MNEDQRIWPHHGPLTQEQFEQRMNALTRKRNLSADQSPNTMLWVTYQSEINQLVEDYPDLRKAQMEKEQR